MSSRPGEGEAIAIRANALTKRYGPLTVLEGVDLSINQGEFAVLVGPSGSGKSTVLHLVAALEPADGGTLMVAGHQLHRHARGLSRFRRRDIGIIFQLHNLIPRLSARENVEAAMFGTHHGRHERTARATTLLERLDLADRADDRPTTMSGGERQRVAIARALANEPKILLADEPTGSLDADSADIVLAMFGELVAAGTTILAVSHDDRLTDRADRLIPIIAGKTASTRS